MKIAIVAAEVAPHAKTGGLADVIGALPAAFKRIGHQPSLIVPGYKSILQKVEAKPLLSGLSIPMGDIDEPFSVSLAHDRQGVPMYLIEHPGFFERDGIYGERGADYPDNLRRFIFFGRAAAFAAAEIIGPDVIHAHDWHASATPIVVRADAALRQKYRDALSIFTIHNLAFQGVGDPADFPLLGIDASYFSMNFLEFYARMNLMKGAIVLADGVSTVSPTYAREVVNDPELGFALEGVLAQKKANFVGILNGADYNEWDPAKDRDIAATYTPQKPDGKRKCSRALREMLKLPNREEWPIVGMVTRMTEQKGVDLLRDAIEPVMELDLQLVMLASGDAALAKFFKAAEQKYPDQIRVILEFDNVKAHQIQAGSDAFLMPSRFEPCGLTQMYALRYGSAPIVRATGGLRDTVSEFDAASGTGNGFVFEKFEAAEMVAALSRAVATFRNREGWRRLMANCFAADFSWEAAAHKYVDWFARLRKERGFG
ncbi:MAG: glycogen synthase GlgA [Candidatus Binatus sp.]|uniref:glycogen synthase GlgA n=1 Tax=Candidatus Binatus sp. TaxID=2811406 RepID=UPI0027231E1E|nr:glycogen synthase GlgA [Candidatus Binatus sp.]MDO8434895.1 glycogen synthase GlgA [Candidatus Binatus sp.]